METKLSFGKVSVPLEDYAIQGNAILGIKESGKSYTATYCAERLMDAGYPIVALDPIGIWHSLRIAGTGEGYPVVVVGGAHGDLPLTPASAEATMRAALAAGVSVVFDLFDIQLSKRQWRDIVLAVTKVLIFDNKGHGPRHIFVEESAEFVPQRIGPDQGEVFGMMERLVRMGGNCQVGVTLINPRAEEVNKSVLELCDCLILHRQKGRRALENLGKWLEAGGAGDNVVAKIPMLGAGEAFVWPRGDERPVRTQIPEKRTFHPDRRARRDEAKVEQKRMDAGEFVEKMKGELAKAGKPSAKAVRPRPLDAAATGSLGFVRSEEWNLEFEKAALKERAIGFADGWKGCLERVKPAVLAFVQAVEVAMNKRMDVLDALEKAMTPPPYAVRTASFGDSIVTHPAVRAAQRASSEVARRQMDAVGIPEGEFAVMRAIAMYQDGIWREQLSVLTGYKRSTRNLYIQRIIAKGWATESGDRLRITAEGIKALGSNYEPLPTGQALQDYWLQRLPEGERRLLQRVLQSYPSDIDRGELSAHTGYKRSTRNLYLQRLASRQLIVTEGDGVKASEVLFQ